jgi:hypothetical protein
MLEPKEGEAFEYAGLEFAPDYDCGWPTWAAYLAGTTLILEFYGKHWRGHGNSPDDESSRAFGNAEDAVRWAVRACPTATCSTCLNYCGEHLRCVEDITAAQDGFCHLWVAKECDE